MLDNATYTPRLKGEYAEKIRTALKEEFGYKNEMQIPRLDKIVLNIGCGAEAVRDSKKAKSAQEDLTTIAGQKALTTVAKKSIAGFRVREDMPLGAKVTLRGERMYEFLDRLITIAMPRIRDFRGINGNSFDGQLCFHGPEEWHLQSFRTGMAHYVLPVPGEFYVFPAWQPHSVTPFRGEGERWSLAFNAVRTSSASAITTSNIAPTLAFGLHGHSTSSGWF